MYAKTVQEYYFCCILTAIDHSAFSSLMFLRCFYIVCFIVFFPEIVTHYTHVFICFSACRLLGCSLDFAVKEECFSVYVSLYTYVRDLLGIHPEVHLLLELCDIHILAFTGDGQIVL